MEQFLSVSGQRDPPESMVCPITRQLMTDPVMDPDGYSYERMAITRWLETNDTSPVTRKQLSVHCLKPNRALAHAIAEHREREAEHCRKIFEKQHLQPHGPELTKENLSNLSQEHASRTFFGADDSPTSSSSNESNIDIRAPRTHGASDNGIQVERHVRSTGNPYAHSWNSAEHMMYQTHAGDRQQSYSVDSRSPRVAYQHSRGADNALHEDSRLLATSPSTHDTGLPATTALPSHAQRANTRPALESPLELCVKFVNGECCGESADVMVGHVTVMAPQETSRESRPPVDMCFVLDTSGSMNAEARLKVDNGSEEGDGLSLLDVVRHGVRTVVGVLEPRDRVAVVKYSSTASIVHRLLPMNASGKSVSEDQIQQLRPAGTTNLWEGLNLGLDVLREEKVQGRTQCLMLLTDGVPNVEPPRGHIPMLQRYLRRYGMMRECTINTFGFGYDLDSDLLRQIAFTGLGTYNFIPDVGFVGTAFIHAVSNILTVVAKNVQIEISPEDPEVRLSAKNVCGGFCVTPGVSSGGPGITVSIGSVCFEQNRDLCIKVPRSGPVPRLCIGGAYTDAGSDERSVFAPVSPTAIVNATTETIFHCCRIAMAVELLKCAQMPPYRCSTDTLAPRIESLLDYIRRLAPPDSEEEDDMFSGLMRDLTGQVREAVSRMDWYNRWGRHYFPSLMFAHLMQQCNNFKDPGVQGYGGSMFKDIRDDADELFCGLSHPVSTRQAMPPSPGIPDPWGSPPVSPVQFASAFYVPPNRPQTTPAYTGSGGGRRGVNAEHEGARAERGRRYPSRGVSMARYNCSSAPCFAGHCRVAVPPSQRRQQRTVSIASLRRGDKVLTPDGGVAKVVCLVVTRVKTQTMFFVPFPDGLLVTPYHPVRVPTTSTHPGATSLDSVSVQQRSLDSNGIATDAATTRAGRWCTPQALYPVYEYQGCSAVYNVVLDRGHVITINNIECITLGHGVTNHAVLSHAYLGTQRIVDDLANCPGWQEGRVVIADMLRDPKTSLVNGLRPCRSHVPIGTDAVSIIGIHCDDEVPKSTESPQALQCMFPRQSHCENVYAVPSTGNLASTYNNRFNCGLHNWRDRLTHQNQQLTNPTLDIDIYQIPFLLRKAFPDLHFDMNDDPLTAGSACITSLLQSVNIPRSGPDVSSAHESSRRITDCDLVLLSA